MAEPRILDIDIETTPAHVLVWDIFKPVISLDQVVRPTSILCFAAKWHGTTDVLFHKSQRTEGAEFRRMIRAAHDLLSQADAVCHYNGASFDIPRLNSEFARLGLRPTPPIPQVDLHRVVKTKFSLLSNKLAFVAPYLGVGEKIANDGWKLWRGCLDGDPESWRIMESYCCGDVKVLEPLYLRLLPWIDGHPNHNLYVDDEEPVCTNCGSDKLQSRGLQINTTLTYKRYQCQACGHWVRARFASRTGARAAVR